MGAMTDTSHTSAPGTQPEETLGMLIANASRDLSALVQGEIALAKAGKSIDDVERVELNEAFSSVVVNSMKMLGADPEKVNVNGGAVALGHPIGASGARIVVTLLGALRKNGKKKGVAALCIGGGEATALAVEMV